jgi:hypothetical protein
MNNKTWLDAITDGQILRDWFSLILSFGLGWVYFVFFATMFAVSLGLSIVLVGIPLLLFTLASLRVTAKIDRQLMAAVLQTESPEVADDLDLRGANLGERLGMILGSALTWRSLVYLLAKLGTGMVGLITAIFAVPLLAIEVLILGPLTIDMHLLSVRLLHGVAIGMHKFEGMLLPSRKAKRAGLRNHLELQHEEEEPLYYLEDDGEVVKYKHS